MRSVCSAPTWRRGQLRTSSLRGVTKPFGDLVAVDDVDLDVQPGEFLALLGPSGCGKTTTLRMIAGFDEPTEGEIEIGGRSAVGIPPNKRDVNTVFQAVRAVPAHDRARQRRATGSSSARSARRSATPGGRGARARPPHRPREAKPAELSGGMQQRVALARALVMKPKVLLLDEPLGALDLKLRKAMQIELKRIQRDVGITFIVVTHDQEEAMAMADRIAVMNAGRIDQLARAGGDLRPPGDAVRGRLHRRHEPLEGSSSATATTSWRVGRPASASAASSVRPSRRRRAHRAAARGDARQRARRGHARDVPDRDGARATTFRSSPCSRRARKSSPASAAPATRACDGLSPATSCGWAGARPPRCSSVRRTARPRAAPEPRRSPA